MYVLLIQVYVYHKGTHYDSVGSPLVRYPANKASWYTLSIRSSKTCVFPSQFSALAAKEWSQLDHMRLHGPISSHE